jgi:hypothetical protein
MSERLMSHAAPSSTVPRSPASLPAERTLSQLGRLELVCTGCGYGAIAKMFPTRCPMCGGLDWDFADWRSFSSATRERP